ncbi:hypothetical protein GCM10010443_61800 [Actinoplanes cyaneus]|uniref:hypothetical protein n=1 Tax=Actinoplanes cyaneus TaxID=52696 RepID=UPI0031D44B99
MTSNFDLARTPVPRAGRVVCPDSLGRALLAMAVPPVQRRGDVLSRVLLLGRRGDLLEPQRPAALAADALEEAVPLDHLDRIDAEAVARWMVGHHPGSTWPAVVLGSPHGAAVQLAAACGAAWLPTTFTVTAPWPGGATGDWAAAMAWGTRLARRIMAANPGVTVRQVHDPVLRGPLCGTTVSLHVSWRSLPEAYRAFLRSRVVPGGASVLVRDLRTWPALSGPPGYSFQIGTPTSGWSPAEHSRDNEAFRRLLRAIGAREWTDPRADLLEHYAETSGEPGLEPQLRQLAGESGSTAHRVLYTDPQALSAAVADLYRSRQAKSHGGSHAVVGTGRMTDPWQVLDAGLVPYWCESSSRAAALAAELWLAGSRPFDRISVLPEPPGTPHEHLASLTHWRSVAAFARRTGLVDRLVAGRYPTLPIAAGHASHFFRHAEANPRRPEPIPVADAVRHLAASTTGPDSMIVS